VTLKIFLIDWAMRDPRDKIERFYNRTFDTQLAKAFKKVIADIEKGVPLEIIATQGELYFDRNETRENLFGLYQDAIKAGAKEAERVIPGLKTFDPHLFNQEFWRDEFWQRHAFSRLELINESNRLAVTEVVKRLTSVEFSSDDLIKTFLKFGQEISTVRSYRIVRTETTAAFNYSIDKVARDFGTGNLVAVWSAARNNRTRPTHLEADGQERGEDGYFRVGSALLRYPGDPAADNPEEVINCRCRINYRRK
jgi:hypothetical protein